MSFPRLSIPVQPAGEGGPEEAPLISGCSLMVVMVPVTTAAKIWFSAGQRATHEPPWRRPPLYIFSSKSLVALQEPDLGLAALAPASMLSWSWVTSPCPGDRHDMSSLLCILPLK